MTRRIPHRLSGPDLGADMGPGSEEPPVPLVLRDVRYAYAGSQRWALDGIDLELASGRVLGLVGPNEAGKSTLCLVAAGLAPAAIGGRLDGRVLLGGRDTVTSASYEIAQRAGILFQNPATQLSATAPTVYEEVAFGPRNLGLPLDEVTARVEDALTTLRINALAARDPMHLSGGQAQLVALASVVALRPPVLVLDEPTSQLDPAGTRLVGSALAGLAATAATAILVVEHKTWLLAGLADEIALISSGRIVDRGPTLAVLEDERLVGLGVEPPPAIRLRRAVEARGMSLDPELLVGVSTG